MLAAILTLLILYACWAPTSWLGTALHQAVRKWLVRSQTLRPATIVCFVVVCSVFATLIVLGEFDGLLITALAAPETFAMFLAVDVGIAVEITVAAWFAASQVNFAKAFAYARRIYSSIRIGRPAHLRRRPREPRAPRASDRHADEGESFAARTVFVWA